MDDALMHVVNALTASALVSLMTILGCSPSADATVQFSSIGKITSVEVFGSIIYSPPLTVRDEGAIRTLTRALNEHREGWSTKTPWGDSLQPSPIVLLNLYRGDDIIITESLDCDGWLSQYQWSGNRFAFRSTADLNDAITTFTLSAVHRTATDLSKLCA